MKPSLPVPNSSLSIWHRTTRAFPHLHANRLADVPSRAKYLVIGSGISGALTAYKLIEAGAQADEILILEAREAVSGATGRNAGHIRPDAFRGFLDYAAVHGSEQARKILENERVVLARVREFVSANNVDCDFKYTTTFEVCLSEEIVNRSAKALAAYEAAGADISHIKFFEGEEAKERTRVRTALSAYESPAASNHPGKLCQWILSDVIKKGVNLWTHCPATQIVKSRRSTTHRWDVHTPRGIVAAETVIHCTNAYAAYLVPELDQFISPRRAQAHAFIPRRLLSGSETLQHTMALRYGPEQFFSVNSLLNGTILLGGTGTRTGSPGQDGQPIDLATFDDTGYSRHIAGNSTREFFELSQESQTKPLRHGEGLDHVWTGIIGVTPDRIPLVGSIEGLEGQWVCAGFNGHGMAGIFTCAPGLVKLINGGSWEETGLPECFQYSKARIGKSTQRQVKSSL
ncbi:FAD dependent oxidoreductase [Aspergillus steynii IBT 23096]|uniref:FAD dependent oxidoreductase n=1 Tax=Aspergillus steynii IBT 23096 TaxID=1392250 RepID=A0A2I2GEZ8_9EURO|nr:FAD dependent oxidoreductase [Aspergillus steynii IBT 23096]PLB51407.1 FAD dependent oxidoreductase [Aspergillus steynii IBT 23096]